jgi:serine phosphatase RsbU (regulator of sigma subunit)
VCSHGARRYRDGAPRCSFALRSYIYQERQPQGIPTRRYIFELMRPAASRPEGEGPPKVDELSGEGSTLGKVAGEKPSEQGRIQTAAQLAAAHAEPDGGDLHVIEQVGTRTVIVVADVMGKGAEAAPCADRVRALLAEVLDSNDPAVLLERLNTALRDDRSFDRYVTASAMILDPAQRSASWALAGHLPPHRLDTGMPTDGATPGVPLNLRASCGATSAGQRPLRPDQGFAMFTDGLEDVRGPGGDRFGTARVTHCLANDLNGATPEQVVAGLKRAACEFGGEELYDDICIAACRYELI